MFSKVKTLSETKKLYYRLAMFLHPDKGGDSDIFCLLGEAYSSALEKFDNKDESYEKNQDKVHEGSFQPIYDDVVKVKDPRLNLLYEMRDFAQKNPNFKSDFLNSVTEFLCERNYITSSQYNALLKVYYAFEMHKPSPIPETPKPEEKKQNKKASKKGKP